MLLFVVNPLRFSPFHVSYLVCCLFVCCAQPSLPAKKSMRQLAMEKKQRVEQSEREREQQRERGGSMRHKHLLRGIKDLS